VKNIDNGYRNLALLPRDMVERVAKEVKAMEEERDQIAAELKRREGGGNLADLEEGISACEAILWRLREPVKGADRLLLRGVILRGGTIHLRPTIGKDNLSLSGET
jgi:hypothetical protein